MKKIIIYTPVVQRYALTTGQADGGNELCGK